MEKRPICLLFLMPLCLLLLSSCDFINDPDGTTEPVPVINRSGFIKIPSIEYSLRAGFFRNIKSSPVSIFYSFQAADRSDYVDSPIFVFFNGGPGASTSGNLLSMNTTDRTLCKLVTGDNPDAPNPYSWRKMGNLLYIDAPGTGFSYSHGMIDDPCGNEGRRSTEYYHGLNYNPYIDADLMVRAMLEIIKICNVRKNKVILVGESYGGTRTSLMLNMILFYNNYGRETADNVFWEPGFPGVVKAHLNEINGTVGLEFTAAEIARLQFGHHVMIQPQLTGWRQSEAAGRQLEAEGSIIYQLGKEHGKPDYVPCAKSHATDCFIPLMGGPYLNVLNYVMKTLKLDPYNYQKKEHWTDDIEKHTTESLNKIDVLERLLNYDPKFIIEMYAAYRKNDNVFKYLNKDTSIPEMVSVNDSLISGFAKAMVRAKVENHDGADGLESTFGTLDSCDGYAKIWDADMCYAYYMNDAWINVFLQFYSDWTRIGKYRLDPDADEYGRLFLYNLTVMDVMITNATYDFMVYSPSIPPSFEGYTEVDRVEVDAANQRFTIFYDQATPMDGVPQTASRTIFHPPYNNSGHAVSITQPGDLRADVARFLKIDIQ